MVLRFEQGVLDSPTAQLDDFVPKHFEFVHGQLVEKPMGAASGEIAATIISYLRPFVRRNNLGRVFGSDAGYRCFPEESKRLRKPDVSFVALDRMADGLAPQGDFTIPPDLAVEVVSPNDLYEYVEEKIEDYRKAGVKLVWIVSPGSKTVLIRRPDGTATALGLDGELSGESVLPGFTCKVAELFV